MQRKSSARQKAVTDTQRGATAQSAGRVAREPRTGGEAPPSSQAASGEMTLGGHVDRGLTLAGLYDIGVLDRLRLEVRIRLLSDLAQSLAALHLNPRLMAAHPHLVIAPSTVVIGLDGVARVDVRAAKKQESERNPLEADYVAPELTSGDGNVADKRADIYSLGVIAWEAVAGKRLSAAEPWSGGSRSADESASTSDLPAALGGGRPEREPLRRKAPLARPAPQSSVSRLRAPPPLILPEGGEWATALAELAMQAMCADPADRPQDCRLLIHELELIAEHLASTQEIAEVVQGISAVDTLCVPLPTLPDADTACQADATGRLGFMDRQACVGMLAPTCAQRQMPTPRRVVEPVAPAPPTQVAPRAVPEPQPELSTTVMRLREMGSSSTSAWFVAALLSLLVLGTLAGYAASLLAVH
jgi:hypothetical protein